MKIEYWVKVGWCTWHKSCDMMQSKCSFSGKVNLWAPKLFLIKCFIFALYFHKEETQKNAYIKKFWFRLMFIINFLHTVGELKDLTLHRTIVVKLPLSRAVLSEQGYCKMDRFFLRSLALSIPIYRNFQSNGVKWRSIKLRIKKVMLYAIT